VRVLEVNLAKNQIALTMKSGEAAARSPQAPGHRPEGRGPGRPESRPQSAQTSSSALKNDALKKLEAFKAALKGKA
jgi:hypothetical protein